MRVLPVDIDQRRAQLGQRRHRGQTTVEVGTRPTVARHDTAHHHLVVGREHEAAFDDGLGAPCAHHGAVGATSEQQPDGLDHHRLARAGLARDRGQPGPEYEREVGDDSEVGDGEFGEHRVARLWWSAVVEAELCFEHGVEVAWTEGDQPRHPGRGGAGDRVIVTQHPKTTAVH